MREDECRSLLCLQQNFAKMLKPRVQAVVTASCYLWCSEFPERLQSLNSRLNSLGTKVKILLHHSHSLAVFEWSWRILIRKGWILMFFGFFFFLLIRPRDLHYTDTSLLSKRRSIKAESTRKIIVPEHIQPGRNFVVLKLAEDIKLTPATPRRMINNFCDPKTND